MPQIVRVSSVPEINCRTPGKNPFLAKNKSISNVGGVCPLDMLVSNSNKKLPPLMFKSPIMSLPQKETKEQ